MVPANLDFWSISRKENLELQQQQAIRRKLLRTLFCWNDNFNSGYSQKLLLRKRTSIHGGVCFNYEQLFQPLE